MVLEDNVELTANIHFKSGGVLSLVKVTQNLIVKELSFNILVYFGKNCLFQKYGLLPHCCHSCTEY